MKFSTRISRSPAHLTKFGASEVPVSIESSGARSLEFPGASQKSASSCFDHNFLLGTLILMILDSIESL